MIFQIFVSKQACSTFIFTVGYFIGRKQGESRGYFCMAYIMVTTSYDDWKWSKRDRQVWLQPANKDIPVRIKACFGLYNIQI